MDSQIKILMKRIVSVFKGGQEGISKAIGWKGGGSLIYAELKQWNESYSQAIQKAKTTKELIGLYKKMQAEAFFRYEIDLSKFDKKEFGKLGVIDQKKILLECLDKNHLYVNYSEIEDATYKVPTDEKKINKAFYGN
jgi:adenine-specific DNA-methyltransferase